MADQDLIAKKVKAYLEGLSPRARRMLIAGIETSRRQGGGDRRFDTILSVAKTMVRKHSGREGSHDRIMRAFFEPVAPFLVDGATRHKQRGRISRASLGRIWTWIVRDVAPPPLGALLAGDAAEPPADEAPIEGRIAWLRAEILKVIRIHLADIRRLPRGRHRLATQLGGPLQLQDLEDILTVLKHEQAFAELFAKLPRRLTARDLAPGALAVQIVDAFVGTHECDVHFVASGLVSRLEHPRLLALFAVRLAKSENGKVIARSPYGAFIDVLLSEVERRVDLFAENQEFGLETKALEQKIEAFHGLVRVLDVDLDLDGAADWQARLAALRRRMSTLIATEIEPAPDHVRRTLRHTAPAGETLTYDPHGFDDACRALTALTATRRAIDSLAVNELHTRTWRAVETAIETMSYDLLRRYRDCRTPERAVLAAKLDAAIAFSRIFFGEDYASGLKRNRDGVEPSFEKRASTA